MKLADFLARVQADAIHAAREFEAGTVGLDQVFCESFGDLVGRCTPEGDPQLCFVDTVAGGRRIRLTGFALSEYGSELDMFVTAWGAHDDRADCSEAATCAAGDCAAFVVASLDDQVRQGDGISDEAVMLAETIRMGWSAISTVRIHVITGTDGSSLPVVALNVAGKTVLSRVIGMPPEPVASSNEVPDDQAELVEFRLQMLQSVRASAVAVGDTAEPGFVSEAAERLAAAEEFADFEVCRYRGTNHSGQLLRIDGYAFDEVDNSLSVLVTDFDGGADLNFLPVSDVDDLLAGLAAFLDVAMSGQPLPGDATSSSPAAGFARETFRRRDEIGRIRLFVFSDRVLEGNPSFIERSVGQSIAELHVWDIARAWRTSMAESGRDDLEISFRVAGTDGLPALFAGSSEGEYEGYLCTIRGDVLAEIYDLHGSRLLEGNVRSFLTTKGKINSGIQATIHDKPGMFFAYNNGISATAEAVVLSTDAGLHILSARNLQIVNGGQTTASIAFAAKNSEDLTGVWVQMKLSVLPAGKAGELIPLIARYANSQNKVNESDFFANHPYHVRLEEISKRLVVPQDAGDAAGSYWFYERSRGQYVNEQKYLNKSGRIEFQARYPKAQLLTKLDVGRFENAWKGFPHKVSTGAQKNFVHFAGWLAKRWSEADRRFDEQYYRDVVAVALLFRHTERLVKQQAWYPGSYCANIVAYTVALLQYLVVRDGKSREMDLDEIWRTQAVPAVVSDQLALTARAVLDVLTDPGRGKANVTEWAKSEHCWSAAMAAPIRLADAVFDQLIDPAVRRYQNAEIRPGQHAGYGVFARTAVIGVGADGWRRLREWGEGQRLLAPRDLDLLRSAARIPRFLPSVKDCEKIWEIRAMLVRKGFVETA